MKVQEVDEWFSDLISTRPGNLFGGTAGTDKEELICVIKCRTVDVSHTTSRFKSLSCF